MIVAAALAAAPVAARASPDAPLATLAGLDSVKPQQARAAVAGIERTLERELRPRAAPPQGSGDVMSEAKIFYQTLMRRAPVSPQPVFGAGEKQHSAPDLRTGASPLLDLAWRYRGVPYRWGGVSRGGLDCSGLVVRALADVGRRAPHSSALLYQLGQPVDEAELRPGDLVFFRDTYKPGISHVGIYQGDSRFLHASSGAGRVTTGDLGAPYFRERYAGARRLALRVGAMQDWGRPLDGASLARGRKVFAAVRLSAPGH